MGVDVVGVVSTGDVDETKDGEKKNVSSTICFQQMR